ncbi:uncharacterized protein LOC133890124 [Phragmites australis]|uniref:uncharacterized protein LOC133890124 n=1 Tax=Phragmites australis TaxID=29695 RepID=UPI002D76B151|nr:uncharacterized protein LOC133890124 [Phragmites australis]
MPTRRNVQYSPLPTENKNGGNVNEANVVDLQFIYAPKPQRKLPWKSITLANFLPIGISLLSLSYFIFSNHMEVDGSLAYGLLFQGILAFLPGYYDTQVAYYSWRGAPGYTFSSIPDY